MYSKSFENLDDVVREAREAREELPTYRDILEISDRVRKSEPKKEFTEEKKDYSQSTSSFKKKARRLIMENPIDLGQDLAPEDDLLEGSTIGVFPDLNLEAWEACHFNHDFPELDALKEIVKNHGKLFSNLSIVRACEFNR